MLVDILHRLRVRRSTSNSLGITSHTGIGLARGTTGSVWRTLKPTGPGFGTTLEKADFVMWANGAWAEPDQQCVHLNYDAYREWEPQNCHENGHHHNTVKYSALCEADPKFRWPEPTKPTTQPFTPSGGYTDEDWKELDWAAGLGA